MKIGRNEPCPCGSGKKYKNCCLSQNLLSSSELILPVFDNLKSEFAQYNSLDLISALAGLQLWSDNHSHLVRLEFATQVACAITSQGDGKIDEKQLTEVLNKFMPPDGIIGEQEDPPENPFTENIVFHGGNYIVYPGINAGGSFALRKLLKTIFQFGGDIPKDFKEVVKWSTICLLTLSNEIAKHMGHSRYMTSPNQWREEIQMPASEQMAVARHTVVFTEEKLYSLLGQTVLTYLSPFVSRVGSKRFSTRNPQQNPLWTQPLVKLDNNIIVSLPASIVDSLRHFIWVFSERYHIRKQLAQKFRDVLWADINECFRLMLFEPINIELPPIADEIPMKEKVYRIDKDKLVYVQFIADDATDYKDDEPNGIWNLDTHLDTIFVRRKTIIDILVSQVNQLCDEVLFIAIIGGIGRRYSFTLERTYRKTRFLHMSAENLETITQMRNSDNLTLWKYAGALKRLQDIVLVIDFDFLDGYSIYLDRKHSFYLSDEALPHMMIITPGSGVSLRAKSRRLEDYHAVLREDPPSFVAVQRRHNDTSIPIYFPEGGIGRILEQVVEGYEQPIWINTGDDVGNISSELRHTYFEVVEMFTYWLLQLTQTLSPHLKPLGPKPIHIEFRFDNPNRWIALSKEAIQTIETIPKFNWRVKGRTISIVLPDAIQSFLMSADNQGERLILKALIQSFSEMLTISGFDSTLNDKEQNHILDTIAPLGRKKKFFIISTEMNPSLNPQALPRLRLIQDHDIEEQLDGLVSELGIEIPIKASLVNNDDRKSFLQKVVHIYLNRLKSLLAEFAWKPLVEQLISHNEAIWHHRATVKLNIPMRLECFTNPKSEAEILVEEVSKVDDTALSIRTLIEIVAAEPPQGLKEPSLDALDKLIAIIHHFIFWAFISDQIHLGIFDHKIGIMPSGRIGLPKEKIENALRPFLLSKIMERIESSITDFQGYFNSENHLSNIEQPNEEELKLAFKAEFGLTMTQMIAFCDVMTLLGFQQGIPAPHLRLSQIKAKIKEFLHWSDIEIDKVISLFQLQPREIWEKAPPGFTERNDIRPWKYGRRLSYVRRPLIIAPEPKGDPQVFWGSRHMYEACKELLNQVMNGRYKLHDSSSKEMRVLIGRIRDEAGNAFASDVVTYFQKNTDWLVESKVPIRPGAKLSSPQDLGDIDLLIIDKVSKRIYSIECKNINFGRNPREIANEIERFVGKAKQSDSWINKHIERDKWLKNNINDRSIIYGLHSQQFKVVSLFLTSEEIPTTFLRKMDLPCISFSRLKREGAKILNTL